MNRLVAIVGIAAAVILLSPYLGIDLFGNTSLQDERINAARPEGALDAARDSSVRGRSKGKQTMVEDILSADSNSDDPASPQKLSDIERLLNKNGEDK